MGDSETNSEAVFVHAKSPQGNLSVVLEDDGNVAYAYLLEDEIVVGDVWLYNVSRSSTITQWDDPSAMPFLNPQEYCCTENLPRLRAKSNLHYDWTARGVKIWLDGMYAARLEVGAKPGWSKSAVRPGPLANPLSESE